MTTINWMEYMQVHQRLTGQWQFHFSTVSGMRFYVNLWNNNTWSSDVLRRHDKTLQETLEDLGPLTLTKVLP